MRDVQRGAVVVAGVVLQDDHRAGAALLGADIRVEVGKVHVAPAVNPVFLHAVSPFLSFVSFDIPQSEKAGHVRISLAVVSVLCVHIASPCLLSFWFFGYVCSLFVLDAPRAGRASDGGVLHRSIGIEPPRLPCGRAANYGSIIVPNTCHRLHQEQPGFYRVSCIARSFLRSWRTHESGSGVLAHSVGKVPDAWIFSFQGSLSRKALRKLNLRIPCGEICPLTFQWTFFCPLSGITQNIFLLFCGSVRLRHARFAWSCRAPQHMRTGFSPR